MAPKRVADGRFSRKRFFASMEMFMMTTLNRPSPADLLQDIAASACAARAAQVRMLARMACLALILAAMGGKASGDELREVVYTTTPETLKGYLCRPAGAGPFPAVAYNHGGVGDIIGGAPKETCEALAAAGFAGSKASLLRKLLNWPSTGTFICLKTKLSELLPGCS